LCITEPARGSITVERIQIRHTLPAATTVVSGIAFWYDVDAVSSPLFPAPSLSSFFFTPTQIENPLEE
jgi:hypothetical protein